MSSKWIVAILLIQLFSPCVMAGDSQTSASGRTTELDIVGLNSQIVHRAELIEVMFTLHNIGELESDYTINMPLPLDGIVETGLPLTVTLAPGYLRQVKFNLTAEQDAVFETQTATLNITSSSDLFWSMTQDFDVKVAPYSDLQFGVSGISSFVVTPGVRTSVAVNISNEGLLDDNVTFNLYSQTGWSWGWNMNNSVGVNAYETLSYGELTYVYLWIEVPEIQDGMPLESTGPRFQLKAVSSIDDAIVQWSFDLLMNTFHNASIDGAGDDLKLEPGGNGRIPVVIRNNGNAPSAPSITLQALYSNGDPYDGVEISDRISINGWTLALFGGLEGIQLQPNESRTIEIGFQSPVQYSGEIDVRVQVFSTGAISRMQTIDLGSEIEWLRDGEATLLTDSCQDLLPNTSCTTTMSLKNTGNAIDHYDFSIQSSPSFVTATLLTDALELNVEEQNQFEVIRIESLQNARAFEMGEVVISIHLKNTTQPLTEIKIPVKVAPEVQWVFSDIIEEIDSKGRLSVALTLRNEGNAVDGLLVQLQSSHSTDMSFIPPQIAVYEDGVEFPRSFEISQIPMGSNFTVRAWVDLPQGLVANGTVWLNISVRSQFEPDREFIHTSTGDYVGTPWVSSPQSDGFDFGGLIETGWQLFKAWFLMLVAVVVSFGIIYSSLNARIKRNQERHDLQELRQPKQPERVGDWMAKFEQQAPAVVEEPRLRVTTDEFQQAFQSRAGQYKQASQPVDPSLTKAAITVLDHHDQNQLKSSADSLLGEIQTKGVSVPASENQLLEAANEYTSRTLRSDLKEKSLQTSTKSQTSSVPLPVDLDEFDV